MSNIARMMQRATAGAGGAGLDVDEVFSCHLFEGNGGTQSIVNNIDLSGEGGLVWAKQRTGGSAQHALFDTENGTLKALASSSTAALATEASVTSFNSNGFSLGNFNNNNGEDYVSWTFRKAPKFFDVVTYTGNGNSSHAINHNLGSTPGMILVKRTNGSGAWNVAHRSLTASNYYIILNSDSGQVNGSNVWTSAPTGTTFTVGDDNAVNSNGDTFIAYLFAHNNSDGEFGPDGDADIIKCGSYTGTGSTGKAVTLGWEPQWLMIKRTDATGYSWEIMDAQRGFVFGNDKVLRANSSGAEITAYDYGVPTSTGFELTNDISVNASGGTYIYMAIRRGPLAAPDDATDVFAIDTFGNASSTAPAWEAGFPVDMEMQRNISSTANMNITSRLTSNKFMRTNLTSGEASNTSYSFDYQNGWGDYAAASNTSNYSWMWKRAPSYFDVVAYTGTGSARTVSHNLGAVPEMMWIKNREASESWIVYHKALGATKYAMLDKDDADITNSTRFNNTTPTASVFTVGTDNSTNSPNSNTHVAYLFATVAGVSKVGSYTGNGSNGHIIDCGFSNGARFILIRLVGTSGSWYIFDTARGIVSGSDPYLKLDTTDAESSSDLIDPHSSGFIVNNSALINANGYTHIFYAIA